MDEINRVALEPVICAWGVLGLLHRKGRLVRLYLPERREQALGRRARREGWDVSAVGGLPPELAQLPAFLEAYFAGEPVDPARAPARLDPGPVTPFRAAVYRALRRVRRGRTTTYGELAGRAGRPGAARAVGTGMSSNPLPLVIPCHRVLGSGGSLGGYSAPGGEQTKLKLLGMEGALDASC